MVIFFKKAVFKKMMSNLPLITIFQGRCGILGGMNTENSSWSGPPFLLRSRRATADRLLSERYGVALCRLDGGCQQSGGVKTIKDEKKDQSLDLGWTGGGEAFGNQARAGAFMVKAGRGKHFGARGDLTRCGQDARGPLGRRGLGGGRRVGGFCRLLGLGEKALKSAGLLDLERCELARKGRLGGENDSFKTPDQPLADAYRRLPPVAAAYFPMCFFPGVPHPAGVLESGQHLGRGVETARNHPQSPATTRGNLFFNVATRVCADGVLAGCHHERGHYGDGGRQLANGVQGVCTAIISAYLALSGRISECLAFFGYFFSEGLADGHRGDGKDSHGRARPARRRSEVPHAGRALCRRKGSFSKAEAVLRGWRGGWLMRRARLRCCGRGRPRSAAKGALRTATILGTGRRLCESRFGFSRAVGRGCVAAAGDGRAPLQRGAPGPCGLPPRTRVFAHGHNNGGERRVLADGQSIYEWLAIMRVPVYIYGMADVNALLLSGGRVIDPANGLDSVADVLLVGGKVAAVGAEASKQAPKNVERVDVKGLVVCPGLIDLHVHLREPGQSAKETIATGTAAAARGGFTSVVCMPNTSPAIDNPGTVALIREKALREGVVNVFVAGAISKNIEGEELAPIGSLKQAGVVAITDDGHCIQNNDLMRRALEYAKMFDLPVMDHCQDYSLVTDGVMHEGYWSTALGLRGWPAAGEEMIVARNILLAELTGTRVHCQHLSSAGSVALLREAKKRGVPISGEACPHHFVLTDATIAGSEKFWAGDGKGLFGYGGKSQPSWPNYDTNFKMNPPLRSARDREAILEGIVDGTIEILGSDHAPHCDYEKEVEFDYAPFGITGLETELALSLMQLVHTKRLSLAELIRKFTVAPAELLRLSKGTLKAGADADVTVFDPEREWVFERKASVSKSYNNPFYGWPLKGKAVMTIVGGKMVWREQGQAIDVEALETTTT
ncbi:MAG: pyrC [Pedosphaera sp.]|nr:pyrC [Pedosphaera sp.]